MIRIKTLADHRRCVLILAFLALCWGAHAQSQTPGSTKMENDLLQLKDSLKSSYPSLYDIYTSKQFDQVFTKASRGADHLTTLELLKRVKHIASELRDGHFYAGPSSSLRSYLQDSAQFFPLRLHFEHDKTLLAKSTVPGVPNGAELIKIDGRSISSIRKRLLGFISGDGKIITKKLPVLSNVFHFYYLLVYGEKSTFEVVFKLPDGRKHATQIMAKPEKEIQSFNPSAKDEKLLSLVFKPQKVALLRLSTFDPGLIQEQGLRFNEFLQDAFQQISQEATKTLIIDLRDNGGGSDLYGSLLYRYLTSSPFKYYMGLYSATKTLPYSDFRKANSSFNDLRPDMLIREGKRYRLSDVAHDNLREQSPLTPGFEGKLVVLINGGTFSAAAEFCAIAKANKRAIFVGEETGGAAWTNTSAVARSFTLSNSGIQISFGLIRYELPVQGLPTDRGTLPDLPVTLKFQDLINGIDSQMDAALQISNNR